MVLDTQGYNMLLVVSNTEAALPCCSAMDTLWRRNGKGGGGGGGGGNYINARSSIL